LNSGHSTRPQSAVLHHSNSTSGMRDSTNTNLGGRKLGQLPDEYTTEASEASRVAAQEAQASVLKAGGVAAPPVGMTAFVPPTQQQQQQQQAGQQGGTTAPGQQQQQQPGGSTAAQAASMGLGLAHMQATMFGLGATPDAGPVQRVTVPRLDDMLIKALADNYHCQTHIHIHACDFIPLLDTKGDTNAHPVLYAFIQICLLFLPFLHQCVLPLIGSRVNI
jgi:hypothetical protein